ncbi:unnamed protein product [Prunus armeniaca]|uniref:Uncharacterized protein n=1 Tax=Prunus armeniaca TaxID=36596 RepID=A0A6J5TTI1_PRUAR|nr:unnamed protein product [Prunus armeniaca]CAB4297837.1 unnamed protein product [Prunus armeniaca]
MAYGHNFSYAIAGTKIMVCTQDTPAGVLLRRGRPEAGMGNTAFYVRRQSFSFRREGFSCGLVEIVLVAPRMSYSLPM